MRLLFTVFAILVALATPLTAAEMGEDGLHKTDWMRITFKDMSEDLAAANAEGKRMVLLFEQRGCVYCRRMHENVFPDPDVDALIREKFFIVQMNLFGDEEVTDFDGTVLSEKAMARRWGVVFTPTILFMPEEIPENGNAGQAAVAVMPGAFGKWTTYNMFKWVSIKGYETEEHFQKYHAREFLRQTGKTSE